MDSLGAVALGAVGLVEVALFDVALGAVPFCWEHSLKTDWAWIALDCVVAWMA
jgi:hypothetical protein